MRLHLEGMGLMGSLVGHWLYQQSVPFTWHDTDDPNRQAWRASTGSVIPTAEPGDFSAYKDWWRWWQAGTTHLWGLMDFMEPAMFVYASKHPPHNTKSIGVHALGQYGKLRLGSARSLHLNVQGFVDDTREIFRAERRDGPQPTDKVLVTHGFTPGHALHYVWGWHVKVHLKLLANPTPNLGGRVCFYLRQGMVGDYLYPIPKMPGWYYGGASRVVQSEPKRISTHDKVERWVERVTPWLEGVAQVEATTGAQEGWRPAPDQTTPLLARLVNGAERWYIRPQGSSGVRHWPIVRAALAKSDLLEGV